MASGHLTFSKLILSTRLKPNQGFMETHFPDVIFLVYMIFFYAVAPTRKIVHAGVILDPKSHC